MLLSCRCCCCLLYCLLCSAAGRQLEFELALLLELVEFVDTVGFVVVFAVVIVGSWMFGYWFLAVEFLVFVLVLVPDSLLHDVWWMSS